MRARQGRAAAWLPNAKGAPDRRIAEHLAELYGAEAGQATHAELRSLLERYRAIIPPGRPEADRNELTCRDAVLITYGDQVQAPDVKPLQALASFAGQRLENLVSGIHLLPFYPYSSDDGFSVIDYKAVDPRLGAWQDVRRIGRSFRLMFDAVINHVSRESAWFRGFLQDDPRYRDFFIVVEGDPDLSQVVRPRTSPLLTEVATAAGPKRVWTTFSEDQVDLNYANPAVLLAVLDILLFYVAQGAEFIRLDAVAFLWKQVGAPCLHLLQTHRLVQLIRAVLDEVAPHVKLITETNVPHRDNISYFGDGADEAQMVYNFALPPLVMHAILKGDAGVLSEWAADLSLPSGRTTFFNFTASHDGVGLNPARGILPEAEIDTLVAAALAHGGYVSAKANPDGSSSPYELNISYFDALSGHESDEPIGLQVDRFMASQAIMLALAGVPGIYFHSLFGSRGWRAGVQHTGRYRTINRQKLELAVLDAELADPSSLRAQVFRRYAGLLRARASAAAFDPYGGQEVLPCGPGVFAVARSTREGGQAVLCLQNVSSRPRRAVLGLDGAGRWRSGRIRDLISGRTVAAGAGGAVEMQSYETLWLAEEYSG